MNQQGYSWPETILTLSVLIIIFGTLLPFATKMTSQLHTKKLSMHAVETVYHAALAHQYYELTAGSREIDGHQFTWVTYPNQICVSYLNNAKEIDKCIHF